MAEARRVLPIAFIAFGLFGISSVLTASLIGFNRSDLKSKVVTFATSMQVVAALLLIDRLGLIGVALAQIVQFVITAILAWALVLRCAGRSTPAVPIRFDGRKFRELLGFGVRLQGVAMATALFEPVMKYFLSATAGVASLGIYELVSKLIQQVRQLLVAPALNLTPLLAVESVTERVQILYDRAMTLMVTASLLLFGGLCVLSPLIVYVWIGRIESEFILFTCILVVGWLANIVSVPAFLLGVARGRMKWNLIGAALSPIFGVAATLLLRPALGGVGVVIAISAAMSATGLFILLFNCRNQGIRPVPDLPTFRSFLAASSGRILQDEQDR